MSNSVLKVTTGPGLDVPGGNSARWYFNVPPTAVGDYIPLISKFQIEGVTVTDHDFDPESGLYFLTIMTDGPVVPGLAYTVTANSEITFANSQSVAGSSGYVEEDPIRLSFQFSADHDMDAGPAALEGLKFNSNTLSSVTTANVYESDLSSNPEIGVLMGSLTVYTKMRVIKVSSPSTFANYTITAIIDPQSSNYRQLALTFVNGNGSLSDEDFVNVELYRY